MILYGRNLSPFTRRVAIWATLQGHQIERREITVAGTDFEEIKVHNPIGRVPVLVLDDGTKLIETFAICDWLDETSPNGVRLVPANGTARRDVLQALAIANSTVEKAVALVYERNRRPDQFHWPEWQQRLVDQIRGGLTAMDEALAGREWPAGAPDAGAIARVITFQFIEVTNPWVLDAPYANLVAFANDAMTVPAIAETKPSM